VKTGVQANKAAGDAIRDVIVARGSADWCQPYFVEHSARAISKHGTTVWSRYHNKFNDAGKYASWLTKLRHGGCFVAGTPVTVSELPYSASRESSLWSETD
jgi:hypothetical protein